VGLESYRQHNGRYPASLEQLRATGWDVPKDRFTEEEFIYKRRGATFLLYSIGPNLQDEGGQPGVWPFCRRLRDPDEGYRGDIVWEWRPVMRPRSPRR
jgi:hypothetical protein